MNPHIDQPPPQTPVQSPVSTVPDFHNNKQGSKTVLYVILAILAVLLVGGGSYFFGQQAGQMELPSAPTPTLSSIPNTASSSADLTGWKKVTIESEKLSFYYPPQWGEVTVRSDPDDPNSYETVTLSKDKYNVSFDIMKAGGITEQGLGGNGSFDNFTSIGTFTFDGQTVHLVTSSPKENAYIDMYVSLCEKGKKCLLKAKNVEGSIDIGASYVGGSGGGDVAPDFFLKDDPHVKDIINILKSITYE